MKERFFRKLVEFLLPYLRRHETEAHFHRYYSGHQNRFIFNGLRCSVQVTTKLALCWPCIRIEFCKITALQKNSIFSREDFCTRESMSDDAFSTNPRSRVNLCTLLSRGMPLPERERENFKFLRIKRLELDWFFKNLCLIQAASKTLEKQLILLWGR